MKYTGILYFIFSIFILVFGTLSLVDGRGKLWVNIAILAIGVYYLYRGITVTVKSIRQKKEEEGN